MEVSQANLGSSTSMSRVQARLNRLCCLVGAQCGKGKFPEQRVEVASSRMKKALREVGRGSVISLAALGLAATVVLTTAPVQAQVSFVTAPTYAVGDSPLSITVGDLDGDGDLDLATVNIDSGNISVLKNKGNGTFAAPQNFAVGGSPRAITVGDLDGDGDLDLATANSSGSFPNYIGNVSVLKNNGNGTFAAPQLFATGDSPSSITVGDLDGDGDLDLATANRSGYSASVLKNKGNGTFATPQNFVAGTRPESITVGDLDGDGDLDLATTSYDGNYSTVSVLKNNGNGTFAAPQPFATGDRPSSITVGDLDGDGDLDLVTANVGVSPDNIKSVSVLKNNGNGTFATPQNFIVEFRPEPITVGDLDGDGDLDLATVNIDSGNISVLKNKGNGTFALAQNFEVGDRPESITVGDLDDDGDLDLATANRSSHDVSVLKNKGNGTFAANQNIATGDRPNSVTVGDVDRDGDLDLATANSGRYPEYLDGGVSVLKNKGSGTFSTAQNFPTGEIAGSIQAGDLDRDGDLDLVTVNPHFNYNQNYGYYTVAPGEVSVLLNTGDGTFAAERDYLTGEGSSSVRIGDLDRDGDLDLAVANSGQASEYVTIPGDISVLLNNGNGTFSAARAFTAGTNPGSITVGDLDGDGDLDLTAVDRPYGCYYCPDLGTVLLLPNNGNGTFAPARALTVVDGLISMTLGDLDDDGDLDLATANRGSFPSYDSNVSVLKNNGNGTFAAPQNFAIAERPSSMTVGDLDGDGDLDLATAHSNSGTVSILRNNSNGTFAAPQNFVVGDDPRSITAGDLDRDGDLDLATVDWDFDIVSVLESSTPTLQLSLSPNRSNPVPLAGQTVSGNVYVFASGKDTDFLRVSFFIDDPDRSGESFRTELAAPFDLSGTSGTKANPSNSRALTNGTHTITATFARTDGTFRTITSTFTVSN